MKPGAILINTARAGLVEEHALIDALESGRIAHAGLDVFSAEPPSPDDRLKNLGNVTMTSHAAYKTPEASLRLMQRAFALVQQGR
jgi:D-3-phosphoglycerate dehydrogenase